MLQVVPEAPGRSSARVCALALALCTAPPQLWELWV